LNLLRSKDLERTSDFFVDQRRDWAPAQTLAEYERWSARLLVMAGAISRTPLAAVRMPLAPTRAHGSTARAGLIRQF
jgi:hypothetical protein